MRVVGAFELHARRGAAARVEQQQLQHAIAGPAGDREPSCRARGQRHRPQLRRQRDAQQFDPRRIGVFRRRAEGAGVVDDPGTLGPRRAGDAREPALHAVEQPAAAARIAGQRVRRQRGCAFEQRQHQADRREAVAQIDQVDAVGQRQQQHVIGIERQVQRHRAGNRGVARHLAGEGAEAHQRRARQIPARAGAEAVAQVRQPREIGLGQRRARGPVGHRRRRAFAAQRKQRARRGS